jgi:hypothetical protein
VGAGFILREAAVVLVTVTAAKMAINVFPQANVAIDVIGYFR